MKNNKKMLVMVISMLLLLVAGCANDEFDTNYKHFKESYVLATDFVEKGNDPLKTLKEIDTNVIETELKKMKGFMDKMNAVSESKNEKGICGNVNNYYEGVEFLIYAAKNFNKLSIDEKGRVYAEADFAAMNRSSIKAGDE